jgi:hypothetical protein
MELLITGLLALRNQQLHQTIHHSVLSEMVGLILLAR